MKNGFTPSEILSAKASMIYEAWLGSEGHTALTGTHAHVDADVGGVFSAWDGYIFGSILDLRPKQQIVHEFPCDAPDSSLEVLLEELSGSTRITNIQTDMPGAQVDSYRQGWQETFFQIDEGLSCNKLS